MRELETWGAKHQQLLHMQGFGRVPVDDLLEPVRDRIAAVAADRTLDAIVMSCDFKSDQVELVDVTDDLVALYEPNEATLKTVQNIRAAKVVPLTELTHPTP
jgi:hypothetical protein